MKIDDTEVDFAALLEESFTESKKLEPGQLIEAEIVSISGGCVFIQLDGKSEGQIDIDELKDENGDIKVKVGDLQKAYFLSSKNGDMIFTTKISGNNLDSNILENAFETGIPLEGVVDSVIKGGYNIKIGDSRAFCPFSQIGLKRVENPEEYIGTKHTFKIIEYGEKGRNIIVSSRVLLEEIRQDNIEVLKESLTVNKIVKGIVLSLEKFGAFVNIDGFKALLPISEISRGRVDDITNYLKVGQEIECSIIELDWDRERVTLSIKALIKDPWDEVETKYKCDSKHKGEVVKVTKYGVFVTLEPGLDGLIHISEIEEGSLKKGDKINVMIKSIDSIDKRISLKPVSSDQEEEAYQQYLEPDDDTYNPFAELFKNNK